MYTRGRYGWSNKWNNRKQQEKESRLTFTDGNKDLKINRTEILLTLMKDNMHYWDRYQKQRIKRGLF